MPLEFRESKPMIVSHCIHILATDREKNRQVLCKVTFGTLKSMEPDQDPLKTFEERQPWFESVFSKMWDMGHVNEQGHVVFSTTPRDCPENPILD
ncbi:MAG: hypothetical protein ACOC0U_03815 [Desulfovibrionales bacterium]